MDSMLPLSCLLLSGALGLIAIWHENRKKRPAEGLTRHGRWLFILTAVLGVISIASYYVESAKGDAVIRQQLSEIRRAVYATSRIRGSFALVYPIPADGSSKYQARMSGYAREWPKDHQIFDRMPGTFAERWHPNGTLWSTSFFGTSSLAPKPSDELDEAITVDLSAVRLKVFVRNTKVSATADLELRIDADARRNLLQETFDFPKNELTVWTAKQEIRNHRNFQVRSVEDLLDAHLVIDLPHDTRSLVQQERERYLGQNNDENLRSMWQRVRLSWILLEFEDWGDLCLTAHDLRRESELDPTYVVDLPSTMNELHEKFGNSSRCEVEY